MGYKNKAIKWSLIGLIGLSTAIKMSCERRRGLEDKVSVATAPYTNRVGEFFSTLYKDINLNNLNEDEKEKSGKAMEILQEYRIFVSKNFPFVNVENPATRDLVFFMRYGEAIDMYRSYKSIDIQNLTGDEKEMIGEFNAKELIDNDMKFMRQYPWVNAENPTDKDKVWLIGIMRTIQASYMINTK